MFFRHVRLYVGNKRGYQFAVPAFGLFLFVFDVSLCVFSFCLLLRMFSILQCGCLFGLLVSRDLVFYTTSFLSDVALANRAPRILHPSISLLTEMEVLGLRTWLDSFSCISVSLCYLFASFNEWGKTASPLESAGHNIAWLDQLGGEYSCWCAAFAGPSHIKERAHHSLSVKTVSCLQGALDGLFV